MWASYVQLLEAFCLIFDSYYEVIGFISTRIETTFFKCFGILINLIHWITEVRTQIIWVDSDNNVFIIFSQYDFQWLPWFYLFMSFPPSDELTVKCLIHQRGFQGTISFLLWKSRCAFHKDRTILIRQSSISFFFKGFPCSLKINTAIGIVCSYLMTRLDIQIRSFFYFRYFPLIDINFKGKITFILFKSKIAFPTANLHLNIWIKN